MQSEPEYRNESVVRRVAAEHGLSEVDAEACFREMLRFLDVVADSDEPLSPSAPVDHAWHAFILHTRDYADYCQDRFGSFVHHQPGAGGGSARQVQELLAARFGAADERFWPALTSDCGGAHIANCGGEKHREAVGSATVGLADCGNPGGA